MTELSPTESVAMLLGAIIKQARNDYANYRRTVLSAGPLAALSARSFLFCRGDGYLDGFSSDWGLAGLDAEEVRENALSARIAVERRVARKRKLYRRMFMRAWRKRQNVNN